MKAQILICAAWLAGSAVAQRPPDPPGPPRPPRAGHRVFPASHQQSYLGVGVAEINAERAKALNLKEERGVEVTSITEDSPAAKAGIQRGDVVLEYNGQRVEGMEQFSRLVRETPAGREARLVIWRNGATQNVTATIGSRPGRTIHIGGERGTSITIPPIQIPLPDLPRTTMSWRSAVLGVESESLNPQLAEFFGVKEGVLVRSVIKDSPAEKAGIKAGDVIVKVDGTAVESPREISGVLRSARGGKRTVAVVLVREKKEMTINVTLEEDASYRPVKAEVRLIGEC